MGEKAKAKHFQSREGVGKKLTRSGGSYSWKLNEGKEKGQPRVTNSGRLSPTGRDESKKKIRSTASLSRRLEALQTVAEPESGMQKTNQHMGEVGKRKNKNDQWSFVLDGKGGTGQDSVGTY